MSKGENIFKKKDGRRETRDMKGYDPSGKIKYGFCYGKTYKEAKEKVTEYKAALVSGLPAPVDCMPHRFAFYSDAWLRQHKTKVKESAYIKYHTILKNHIAPKLGNCFPLALPIQPLKIFPKSFCLKRDYRQKRFMTY